MALSEGAPVRVAVIGLGRFGRLHALTLAGLAEAELVGLVARRTESVESLQQELPGVPGWTDLGVALQECTADAWVVAATTAAHVPITLYPLILATCAAHWQAPPATPCINIHLVGASKYVSGGPQTNLGSVRKGDKTSKQCEPQICVVSRIAPPSAMISGLL